jgi:hypothetical protein
MTVGILTWAYTLLLPSFADAGIVGQSLLSQGPWGISALRPQALIGLDGGGGERQARALPRAPFGLRGLTLASTAPASWRQFDHLVGAGE